MRADIADAIESAGTPRKARSAVARAIKRYRSDTDIANALFVPALLGDLAGQLMVHTYEVPHGRERLQMALGEAQDPVAFLSMGFEEALAYFKDRGLIHPRELERLLRDRLAYAGEAQKLMLERVQQRVYELIDEALREGTAFQEFADRLRADAPGLGITTEDPAYLQTVFRTNVMDAYGAGRARALQDPAVVEARPYRQIRTANDGRVRETHAHADGVVFLADGPIGNLRPPFDYNCRCSVVSRKDWDGEVADSVPDGLLGPGFGGL